MQQRLNPNPSLWGMMQKIVYDPVSWIHPQRFAVPEGFTSPRCQSILNDMLLARYSLSTRELDIANHTERYLVCHWHVLAKAGLMAVCQRYKATLFRHGLWGKLDKATQQFSLLNLCESRADRAEVITLSQLEWLAEQELGVLSHLASPELKQRIPLLFPEPRERIDLISSPTESHRLIMRMAIQHAKRNA